ncbi:MAG: DUF2974 domain-containing protein [Oscillospiraceae bacterium]|nr:DUF2974 domain-containing protein [Oscillospiraceae bacterium]
MATIMDYLEWRGDVPLDTAGINDADRYVIAKFGMLDYDGILPEDGTYVPAGEAVRRALEAGAAKELGTVTSPRVLPALELAGKSRRFGELLLSGYRLHVAPEENEQFSAVTVRIPGGRHFVTFRGTDDTLVGWKEDLLMSVLSRTPAQADAVKYLRWALETYPGTLEVCGHSKGGNLSICAAASVEPAEQQRIGRIINYDGPGFSEEFLASESYRRIRDRVEIIVPENAMVGTLLYRDTPCRIVRSTVGMGSAHDGFTWAVTPRDGFVPAEGFSPASRAFDKTMKEMLEGRTPEQHSAFIEALFGTLTAAGARTVTDITEQKMREIIRTARNLNQDPEVHSWIMDVLEGLMQSYVAEKRRDLARLPFLDSLLRKKQEEAPPEPEEKTEENWY